MAKATRNRHVLDRARRGAEAQLRDLLQEIRYLLDLFPDLRDSFDRDELPLRFIMARESGHASRQGAARRRPRPKKSPRG